eukprot:3036500-Rhodomonas_salina.1
MRSCEGGDVQPRNARAVQDFSFVFGVVCTTKQQRFHRRNGRQKFQIRPGISPPAPPLRACSEEKDAERRGRVIGEGIQTTREGAERRGRKRGEGRNQKLCSSGWGRLGHGSHATLCLTIPGVMRLTPLSPFPSRFPVHVSLPVLPVKGVGMVLAIDGASKDVVIAELVSSPPLLSHCPPFSFTLLSASSTLPPFPRLLLTWETGGGGEMSGVAECGVVRRSQGVRRGIQTCEWATG